MKMQTVAVILGAKAFKGEVDGQSHDFTKLYVEEPFSSDNENAKGTAAVEFNAGKSDLFYSHLKSLPFPIRAELTLETVTNGKTSKTIVLGVKPLQQVQQAK